MQSASCLDHVSIPDLVEGVCVAYLYLKIEIWFSSLQFRQRLLVVDDDLSLARFCSYFGEERTQHYVSAISWFVGHRKRLGQMFSSSSS